MKKLTALLMSLVLVLGMSVSSFAEYKPLKESSFNKKPAFEDVVVDTVSTNLLKKGSTRELRMNIYKPEGITDPTPVVIYIHGGAWNSGDYTCKDLMAKDTGTNDPFFACMRCLDLGCTVVTADYRLSQEELFPAMVWDLKGQIRFL